MFEELKPLLQNGERYIVVEGGRPEYVLMRFADYSALLNNGRSEAGRYRAEPVRATDWERANVELEAARNVGAEPRPHLASEALGIGADPLTIRLEDLPL